MKVEEVLKELEEIKSTIENNYKFDKVTIDTLSNIHYIVMVLSNHVFTLAFHKLNIVIFYDLLPMSSINLDYIESVKELYFTIANFISIAFHEGYKNE